SLLITTHDRFALRGQCLGVFVEIEHRTGPVHKVRSRRALPGVIAPGFDLVLPQPGPNRPRRDVRHDMLLNNDLDQFFPGPARPRFAVGAWHTTGQRANLRPLQRSAGAAGAGTRGILHAGSLLPALAPMLDGLDTAAHLPGKLRIPPGGILMGEQENPCTLDLRKRGGVTVAELLQISLLLWCELDGILGQRSWHKNSPPA